jgi:hypothetical protein
MIIAGVSQMLKKEDHTVQCFHLQKFENICTVRDMTTKPFVSVSYAKPK